MDAAERFALLDALFTQARDLPLDALRGFIAEVKDPSVRDEVPASLGRLDRSLSGDVETVVAKLLEKEPGRRYQSARELADDLQRILEGQPTLARCVSGGERMLRFARRYQTLLATVAAAFVTLAALLAWTAHLWRVFENYGADCVEVNNLTSTGAPTRASSRQ
ncbi:MAG: hypothetical protein FJ260_10445 [Planctomycetes bacterium]|nr:hypothetical protein [Planctomycetota bacterium]